MKLKFSSIITFTMVAFKTSFVLAAGPELPAPTAALQSTECCSTSWVAPIDSYDVVNEQVTKLFNTICSRLKSAGNKSPVSIWAGGGLTASETKALEDLYRRESNSAGEKCKNQGGTILPAPYNNGPDYRMDFIHNLNYFISTNQLSFCSSKRDMISFVGYDEFNVQCKVCKTLKCQQTAPFSALNTASPTMNKPESAASVPALK